MAVRELFALHLLLAEHHVVVGAALVGLRGDGGPPVVVHKPRGKSWWRSQWGSWWGSRWRGWWTVVRVGLVGQGPGQQQEQDTQQQLHHDH